MQPCWALSVSLYKDSTYGNLSQDVRTPARVSPEKCDGWGCHWNPGAGQVPEEEDGGGTKPRAGSSSGGGLCPLPPAAEGGWTSLLYLSPSNSRLQCFKQAWIFLFAQHQHSSQTAIVSVLFSFPRTHQKSNSVIWLMGLYWPTSAVAINIWRNPQMPQPQWQYSCLPIFLLPNRAGFFMLASPVITRPNFASW